MRPVQPAPPSTVAVAIDNLSFTYAGSDRPALRDVSLRISRAELVVVMGQTGAGKSTLAKCLNCTVPAFQPGTLTGRIAVDGRDLSGCTVADLAGRVGLVLQDFEAQLFATDVPQEIAFALEQLGVPRAEMNARIRSALQLVGLDGFESRDPATLSGGEKQRLAIAAVLAMRPPILVFDEPTTDLDPLGKREVFGILGNMRAQGHTMLLIDHEVEAAAVADRIVLLHAGAVVADGPAAEVRRDVDLLLRHGVRPRDVDRLAVSLSLPESVASVENAECALRERGVRPQRQARPAPPGPRPALVEVRAVTFSYADRPPVLENISLRIDRGEFAALIGQNGSGKTTLAKLMNGLLQPQTGQVLLAGMDLAALSLPAVAAEVGYVFQDPDQQLFAGTVRDEVAFGPRNLGVTEPELSLRVAETITAVGLSGLEDADPFLLGKGQRQRLAVAALLAQRPRLLILDEPTTGLDFLEQQRMMNLLAGLHRSGLTLVVITHSPWVVAEYAGRGILLAANRILFDGPLRALFSQEDLLRNAHFRVPEVTQLGNRFGLSALSVEEFVTACDAAHPPRPARPAGDKGDL